MQLEEDIFQFKSFQIIQNQYVHRVGTDGVLLGAWVNLGGSQNILDVGTGTGLIALMIAQRHAGDLKIDALDVDETAIHLTKKNVTNSSFKDSITIHRCAVQNFQPAYNYDLVVCNPPFFKNSLKSPSLHRQTQRHHDSLPIHELVSAVQHLISPTGRFCLIIPVSEGYEFIRLSEQSGLGLSKICEVYSKEGKAQERFLLEFTKRRNISFDKSKITIMNSQGDWTNEFKQLTKEYYLKF